MKKIISFIFILLFLFVGWKIWGYYQSTYVGQDYYAIVRAPLPKLTDSKSDNGKDMGKNYIYKLVGYDTKGNSRNFDLSVTPSGPYADGSKLEVGDIIIINASKKRIITHKIISKDKVPSQLKTKLGIS